MKVEVHWPEGYKSFGVTPESTYGLEYGSDPIELSNMIHHVVKLSKTYDVIIDNGKVTFVDKE